MPTLHITTHDGRATTTDDPGFAEIGPNRLRIGADATQRLMAFLGAGYGDAMTKISVSGVTYEGCTLDGNTLITYVRKR